MGIDVHDPRMRAIFADDAEVERLATGFEFTEGPVWHPSGKFLIFSDMPGDHMRRWTPADGISTFRKPCNMANGNAYDRQGRLVTCEHASSRVTRTEPDGTITPLATHHDGKELNEYQLYWAVCDGEVRARFGGRLIDSEQLAQLRGNKWAAKKQYALPPDIELSVEDSERLWGGEGDLPTRIALGELSGLYLQDCVERRIDSLDFLVERTTVLKSADIETAKEQWLAEAEFRRRHESEVRMCLANLEPLDIQQSLRAFHPWGAALFAGPLRSRMASRCPLHR